MLDSIKVLVIEHESWYREALIKILTSVGKFSYVLKSKTIETSVELIRQTRPDVILLDIDIQSQANAVSDFTKLVAEKSIPVIVTSINTNDNEFIALEALKFDAAELIDKNYLAKKDFSMVVINVVTETAKRYRDYSVLNASESQKNSADIILPKKQYSIPVNDDKLILIGISTGGEKALRTILPLFPKDSPCILVVQHMPIQFTGAFAKQLDNICQMKVHEARDGDPILPGNIMISPGSHHLLLKESNQHYYIDLVDGPLVNWHKPSIDVLFRSVAQCAGANSVACIMTGMGGDGAKGLLEIKSAGGKTFAQDEQTSTVFGMPQEAYKIGATKSLIPLRDIPKKLLECCHTHNL